MQTTRGMAASCELHVEQRTENNYSFYYNIRLAETIQELHVDFGIKFLVSINTIKHF